MPFPDISIISITIELLKSFCGEIWPPFCPKVINRKQFNAQTPNITEIAAKTCPEQYSFQPFKK